MQWECKGERWYSWTWPCLWSEGNLSLLLFSLHSSSHAPFLNATLHHTSNVAALSPTLSTWSFVNSTNLLRGRKRKPKGRKERCPLQWLHCVLSTRRGKQDQCHRWDFFICSYCCCRTARDTHSNSNYCHLFTVIALCACLHQRLHVSTIPQDPSQCCRTYETFREILVRSQKQADYGFWLQVTPVCLSRGHGIDRHPGCQIQTSGWPALCCLMKAWRQEMGITHMLESDVARGSESHQSDSKCVTFNSSCFQADGELPLTQGWVYFCVHIQTSLVVFCVLREWLLK